MNRLRWWNWVQSWGLIIVGTAIYAFGLQFFIIPNRLMEGGVTGIAVLANYALDVPVSLSSLVINLPLFYIGWRQLGRASMVYTLGGTLLLSLFLWIGEKMVQRDILTPFQSEQDFILIVLYAGVTLGTGLGLVFRGGGTTGGVDIIARIIHRQRGWSIGQIILLLDIGILGTSLLFISKEKVLYTLVSVFIASKLIDFIQEGAYAGKAFTIICRAPEQLARLIAVELERGATLLPAVGAYSAERKMMLYCVVSRYEIQKLKSLVRRHDRQAFIVVQDTAEVLGEGFKEEQ